MNFDNMQKTNLSLVGTGGASYLIKLALARLEFLAPSEFNLATGRLLRLLASRNEGIEKQCLLRAFYPDFDLASAMRRQSLETCLNKLIQRARTRYIRFGIDIHFCKVRRRWSVIPYDERSSQAGKAFTPSDNYQAM